MVMKTGPDNLTGESVSRLVQMNHKIDLFKNRVNRSKFDGFDWF
ncbi:uncharacterized protein G2W53_027502 [Senna tora]|uniref:Uncharacterized protein n=1 Tax=Senna tora TaxID=362788 RepID=A0A834TIT5_9FABA|nr:uncharacterized protein G2W53_027502 [Senna tora]